MNFLNLEYFLVVAEELNVTKAAERLYISQQSLSNHIRRLERDFDTQLFKRKPTLTLTYSGKELVKAATKILDIKRQVSIEIDDINHQRRGNIQIGISHTRGRVLLPDVLSSFKKAYPYVDVGITEGNSLELEEHIIHGKIDLLIGFAPILVSNIETVPILTERLFMCMPKQIIQERFPGVKEQDLEPLMAAAKISDFIEYPFLMMKTGNRIRTMLDKLFAKQHITPDILLETENIETLLALCIKGMGITFYPELFVNNIGLHFESAVKNRDIFFFPISDPITMGHLVIGYRRNSYFSKAAKDFIEFVQKTYKNADRDHSSI